jgi:predicted PurR-regulated permease PerM
MRLAVGAVIVALIALVALAAALIGPSIVGQFDELSTTVLKGVQQVRGYLERTPWGQPLLDAVSDAGQAGSLMSAAGKAVLSAADGLLALVLVLVAGAYLALSPRDYMEGTVHLVPKHRQPRAREVLRTTGNALWLWVLGQLVIMAVVGVLTALGLMLAGVPLALSLGVICGLLEFIPFLGPIIAAVPVILVALTAGPQLALYAVIMLYMQDALGEAVEVPGAGP